MADKVAQLLKDDEEIQKLLVLPGWKVLSRVLEEEALEEKAYMDESLEAVCVNDSAENKAKWFENRVRYLTLVRAANIFADIRESAYQAKKALQEEQQLRKAEDS